MKIGGYGPDGCTCSITACHLCPIHGDEKHLSPIGRQRRNEEKKTQKKWRDWIGFQINDPCPECACVVSPDSELREKHLAWHEEIKRTLERLR